MRTVQLLKRSLLRKVYLVLTGERVQFASRDRSLAEAYYNGQEHGKAVLLAVRVVLPDALDVSNPDGDTPQPSRGSQRR